MTQHRGRAVFAGACLLLLLAAGYAAHSWRNSSGNDTREGLLALLPGDANAVLYADLAGLRQSPFLKEVYAWAPQPAQDAEYLRFVSETGFDYERDLDRLGIAIEKRGAARRFFVVADGRFDEKKIAAYALRTGRKASTGGREIYLIPSPGGSAETSFTFLTNRRIALASDGNVAEQIAAAEKNRGRADWNDHFERLAGSPVFALIRQNAAAGAKIAEQAPGGWRSPQLASLLDELQWISVAGKPAGEHLLVVAEGESAADQTTRQLSDFLNGALLLAEVGLNDPKMRTQMDEQTRNAYLRLLKSVAISRVDRGETKSVRMVLEISPEVLKLANAAKPAMAQEAPLQQPARKKGSGALPKKKVQQDH